MDISSRIETALKNAIDRTKSTDSPPLLTQAVHYSVFPGGARVRPRLCLAVASACGDDAPHMANAAAVAVELLHCASLVHDDMPCFDDAATRRGLPSVHTAYGEPLALLAGDALIVHAFETLAYASSQTQGTLSARALGVKRLAPLISIIAGAVGMPGGIVAGQGWESEKHVPVEAYHRAKTGALFVGSAMAGAVAAGADPAQWRALGDKLGAAYQAADDLRDALCDAGETGKPAGQDAANQRPSLVSECGVRETVQRLEGLVAGAIAAIPDCRGADMLQTLILNEAKRLQPTSLAQAAA